MSKKKATMTLKDFHGGSIPSDLPLPSAPGVVVRSSEWTGYDRPNSWGGPLGGRPDHRARPNSSPATRHFDDKTPFLSNTAHIGRHFDEDERKPLDGGSTPRRTVSDDGFRVMPRVELRPEPIPSGRSPVVAQMSSRSYSGRVSEGGNVGVSVSGMNVGQGSHTNVWAARKELAVGVSEPVQPAWSGTSVVSKLANASALEKVSSGRWQSKLSVQHQAEVEVIEHLEWEKDVVGLRGQDVYADNRNVVVAGGEYFDATLARHVERGLALEDGSQSGRKEYVDHERIKGSLYSPLKEKSVSAHGERVQPFRADVRFSGSDLHAHETVERPKVKLLPRTKPLEGLEAPAPVVDRKQGYQQPSNPANGQAGTSNELHGNNNAAKSSSIAPESDSPVIERPKLNLKPRSQPIAEIREKERVGVFGGARPREMVLKERGVDGAPISNHDLVQQPDRVKHNVLKTERVPDHAIPTRHGERNDNLAMDQRTGKNFERKDQRTDNERVDKQRKNWRNENWRNNSRENERQQVAPVQQQERPPSPETWRKPVEPPKPASPDTAGRRYGKMASALELAQAFSKSFSDQKPAADKYAGQQRGLHGKSQPF
ncbi:eukaryotic translation initiation factor-related [Euphorbia peplus]|nr:eukaryotic translation initiation factor-related [Euphorbia peplus]